MGREYITDECTNPTDSSPRCLLYRPRPPDKPKSKTRRTTGTAPAATPAAGTGSDWADFNGWTRGQLQARTMPQLLDWMRAQGLEHASLKTLETRGRLSQRKAQALRAYAAPSNDSTSPELVSSNGWH